MVQYGPCLKHRECEHVVVERLPTSILIQYSMQATAAGRPSMDPGVIEADHFIRAPAAVCWDLSWQMVAAENDLHETERRHWP